MCHWINYCTAALKQKTKPNTFSCRKNLILVCAVATDVVHAGKTAAAAQELEPCTDTTQQRTISPRQNTEQTGVWFPERGTATFSFHSR